MSATNKNSPVRNRIGAILLAVYLGIHTPPISAEVSFPLLKIKPAGFVADREWYDYCASSQNAPCGIFDIDNDGISDSLFFKPYRPDLKKMNWKRFPWVKIAIKLTKSKRYFLVPAMITGGHSPVTLSECCGDCPNAIQFRRHECDTAITFGFTHGIPPEFELNASGDAYIAESLEQDQYPVRYYYPQFRWMDKLHRKQATELKLPAVLGLPSGNIPPETRHHWMRQYYVKIAGDSATVYSAVEVYLSCDKKTDGDR